MKRRPLACAALLPFLVACGGDELVDGDGVGGPDVRTSVEQVMVTHAAPGAQLRLLGADGAEVASGSADDMGSWMARELAPGDGYRLEVDGAARGPYRVHSRETLPANPDLYRSQKLEPGFGYIETRDGTKLSIYVQLPGPPEDGPYPTLVNYSGYSPSQPGEPLTVGGLELSAFCDDFAVICDVPGHPAGIIAGVMGFATVGVNMRGTGCSGGAYDYFETMQKLDGYDVIETVAAQDWVLHGKVGMLGLSYPGISQLFVAAEQPPSLSAIAPLSVIGNTLTTLTPGGILNDGFALNWADNVLTAAEPFGRGWVRDLADAGDETCAENQLLRGQNVDIIQKAIDTPYYTDDVALPLDPSSFVDRIEVPVFLAGAWQDEQTGPYFATLLDRFRNAPVAKFTTYNGVHADGYSPQILTELNTFLGLYVTGEVPAVPTEVRDLGPLLFLQIYGDAIQLPPDRFSDQPSLEAARAAYEAEDDLRIIFESGASPDDAKGAPMGAFSMTAPAWPLPNTEARRWYLHADGSLASAAPSGDAAVWFRHDPEAGDTGVLPGGGINDLLPEWDWPAPKPEYAVAFETAPLASDTVMAGTGSVDLWVKSDAADADIEVTLSEVRADGDEMYVQSGWLRASYRALSGDSTDLSPRPTYLERDNAPLPSGEWTLVRVEIAPFAHAFRAGSRVRLIVDTPGGSRAEWRFRTLEQGSDTRHRIAVSADHASSIALPIIPGAKVPTAQPPCPSLRGQPCRSYASLANGTDP